MVTPANPTRAAQVRAVVEPVVTDAGLVLEDVVVQAAGRRSVVRLVVDLGDDEIGGLDLDRLGDVSREVSAAMDLADPVHGAYALEVSTPGVDRPLTTLRHLRRARTRLVTLTMADGTTRAGRLVVAEADRLELATADGGALVLDPAAVVRGRVEVELTHAHDDEEGLD